jgi:uridylate kinase
LSVFNGRDDVALEIMQERVSIFLMRLGGGFLCIEEGLNLDDSRLEAVVKQIELIDDRVIIVVLAGGCYARQS